jgi:hypothetical protein
MQPSYPCFSNKFYLVSGHSPPLHPPLTACPHFQYRKGPTCTPLSHPLGLAIPKVSLQGTVTIGPHTESPTLRVFTVKEAHAGFPPLVPLAPR